MFSTTPQALSKATETLRIFGKQQAGTGGDMVEEMKSLRRYDGTVNIGFSTIKQSPKDDQEKTTERQTLHQKVRTRQENAGEKMKRMKEQLLQALDELIAEVDGN